ncbi:MAG: zinc ribbon domain-containing protein [Myxococcota bacterium]|nr:zinc ribbon domain-containing protein [Myxococcota bacterium]
MPWVASAKSSRTNERWLLFVEFSIAVGIIIAVFGENYGLFATLLFILCAGAFAFTGQSVWRMLTSLNDPRLEIEHEPIDEVRNSLLREKKLLTEGLKELEADYAAGKVDAADYEILRGSAETRAIEVIKRIKNEDAKWLEAAKQAAGVASAETHKPDTVQSKDAKPKKTEPATGVKYRPAHASLFSREGTQIINGACTACKTQNSPDARFCIGCGRAIESRA